MKVLLYFHLQDGSQRGPRWGWGLLSCGDAGGESRKGSFGDLDRSARVTHGPRVHVDGRGPAGASLQDPLVKAKVLSLEMRVSLLFDPPLFLSLKVIKMTQNVSKGGAGQDGDCRSVVELYPFSP